MSRLPPIIRTLRPDANFPVPPRYGAFSLSPEIFVVVKDEFADCPNIIRTISAFYLLGTCKTWSQWIAIFGIWNDHTTLSLFTDTVLKPLLTWANICDLAPRCTEHAVFQAGEEGSEADIFTRLTEILFTIPFASLKQSSLFFALTDFLSVFTLSGVMQHFGFAPSGSSLRGFISSITPLLRKGKVGEDPLESLFSRLLALVKVACERVADAYKTGDLSRLFSTACTLPEWLQWTTVLLYDSSIRFEPGALAMQELFAKRMSAKEYPRQIRLQLSREGYINMFEETIAEGGRLLKAHSEDTVTKQQVSYRIRELEIARIACIEQVPHGSFRPQPMGIVLYGETDVGKTGLCSELHAACAHSIGHQTDAAGMLRLDASTNFADAAQAGQITVLFDDIDAKVTGPTAGHDSHVEIINRYLNNAPFMIEKAAIEEKGKFWAAYLLGLYTTNYPDLRLQDAGCVQPNMVYRRFNTYIHLMVKPEFATSSGAIDKDKLSLPDGTLANDIHIYKVFEYDSSLYARNRQYTDLPYREHAIYTSKVEFFKYITTKFVAWTAFQREYVKKRNIDARTAVYCPVCHLLVSDHRGGTPCQSEVELQSARLVDPLWQSYTLWCLAPLGGYLYGERLLAIVGWLFITLWFTYQLPWVRSIVLKVGVPTMYWFLYSLSPPLWWWFYWRFRWSWVPNMVATVHNSQLELDLRRKFSVETLKKIALGTAAVSLVVAVWLVKYRKDNAIEMQMDVDGVWREYRRPPGIPLGNNPYQTVQQKDYLSYGVRAKRPTFTVAEFIGTVRKRLVNILTPQGKAHAFRLKGSYFICNRHLFSNVPTRVTGDGLIFPLVTYPLVLEMASTTFNFNAEEMVGRVIELGNVDLVLLFLPEVPPIGDGWDMLEYLPTSFPVNKVSSDKSWFVRAPSWADESEPVLHSERGSFCVKMSPPVDQYMWQTPIVTKSSDCGGVLIGQFGPHFTIIGFHSLLCSDIACATPFSSDMFTRATLQFQSRVVDSDLVLDALQVNGHNLDFSLVPLPFKSSLRVSMSQPDPPQAIVLGTIHGLGSGSNQSQIVDTLFREDVSVVALESTLGSYPYFAKPRFTGHMIDNGADVHRWADPFTRFLESTDNRPGQMGVWEQALADYSSGTEGLAQNMCMQPLSDVDAFFGVPDTTIGGTNLKTSAGPPHYTRKSAIIRADLLSTPRKLEWEPGFQNQLDTILEVISSGQLYAPLCVHVLKDEVMTVAKNDAMKVRTFSIMPYAFNHLMKRYLAPLTSFMRQHMYHYETAVGMNITSLLEGAALADWLKGNPNWIAFDKTAFDAKCSTLEHFMVSKFFMELAYHCGYTEEDCGIVFRLCLSSIYPIRVIKGDIFLMSCSMPSGFWMTIHFNCVRSALQARYAWYRLRGTGKFAFAPFRAFVRQMCLGDDLVATVHSDASWYDQISIAKVLLEVGAVATSSDKGAELIAFDAQDTVRFLKRKITCVEGLTCWAIEEKTLIKMLCMRRKTTQLSDKDAHALILLNILAEAWMYGRERFGFYQELTNKLATCYGVIESPLWKPNSFDEYVDKYASGQLITWDIFASEDGSHVPLTT